MAGAPLGNQNGTKQKRLLSDCLRRELVQRPEDALAIVNRAIEQAIAGDSQARAWIAERCDGKIPQPIIGGDEDEPPLKFQKIERAIVDPTNPNG